MIGCRRTALPIRGEKCVRYVRCRLRGWGVAFVPTFVVARQSRHQFMIVVIGKLCDELVRAMTTKCCCHAPVMRDDHVTVLSWCAFEAFGVCRSRPPAAIACQRVRLSPAPACRDPHLHDVEEQVCPTVRAERAGTHGDSSCSDRQHSIVDAVAGSIVAQTGLIGAVGSPTNARLSRTTQSLYGNQGVTSRARPTAAAPTIPESSPSAAATNPRSGLGASIHGNAAAPT